MKSEKGSFVVVVLLLMLVLMAFISSIFAMNFNNMALSKAYADHKNELFEVDAAGENILKQVDDYLVNLDESVHDYMLTEKYAIYDEETLVSEELQNYIHLNWIELVLLPSIQLKNEQVGESDLPIDLNSYRGLNINNKINRVIEPGKIYIVDDYIYQELMEEYYDNCYALVYYNIVKNAIETEGITFTNTNYSIESNLEDIYLPEDDELTIYDITWDKYDRSNINMVLRLDIASDDVEKPQNLISKLKIVPPLSTEDTYTEFEGISPNPILGNAISSNGSVIFRNSVGKSGFEVQGDIYSQEGKGDVVTTSQEDWNDVNKTYDKGVIFDGAHGEIFGNIYSRSNVIFGPGESVVWIKGYKKPKDIDDDPLRESDVRDDVYEIKSMLYKPMASGGISYSQRYYMDLSNPYFFSDLGPVSVAQLKSQFSGNRRGTKLIHFDSRGGSVVANGIMHPASLASAFVKMWGWAYINDDVINTSAEVSSIAIREGVIGISKPGDVDGDPDMDDGSTIKLISRSGVSNYKAEYPHLDGLNYNSNGINILFDGAVMLGSAKVKDVNGKIYDRELAVVDIFTSSSRCLNYLQNDSNNPNENYVFKFIDRPAFSVNLTTNPAEKGRTFRDTTFKTNHGNITRWHGGGNSALPAIRLIGDIASNFSLHYEYEKNLHFGWLGGDIFTNASAGRMYEEPDNYTDLVASTTGVDRLEPGYREAYDIVYDSGFLRKKFIAQTENFGFESFDMHEGFSPGYLQGRTTEETGIMYFPDDGVEDVIYLSHNEKIKGIIFAEGDLKIVGPKAENKSGKFFGSIITLGTLTIDGNVDVIFDLDTVEKILKEHDLARKFFEKGALPIPWTSVEVEKSNPLMRKKDNVKRYEILEWSVNR